MSINPTDLNKKGAKLKKPKQRKQKPTYVNVQERIDALEKSKLHDAKIGERKSIDTQVNVKERIAELEEKIRTNEFKLKKPLSPAEKKRIEAEKMRLEKQLEMIKDLFREDSACERVSGCTVALRL